MSLIKFTSAMYNSIDKKDLDDLFSVRKKIFKDKLNWLVSCKNGMEFDEYDCRNASYLMGKFDDTIICGSRFISMKYKNMCTGVFYKYFKHMTILEGNYVEVTRFFIDKNRISNLGINSYPIKLMFFMEMQKFAKESGYQGIYAVVTVQLLSNLIKSGWQIEIQQQGLSEKNETIFLIIMPTDEYSVSLLRKRLELEFDTLSDNN